MRALRIRHAGLGLWLGLGPGRRGAAPARLGGPSIFAAPTLLAAAFAAVILPSAAQALTIDPGASGLDQAQGCGDSACFFDVIYNLDASAPVAGSFDITGATLDFTITLASASLSGSDGAVSSIALSNLTYSGSLTVVDEGAGFYSITDQISSISGTMTPDAGLASAIAATNVNTVGLCQGTPGAALQCGLTFGPSSDFDGLVNGNTRYFRHTVDIAAVPEPTTALLLGLGLTALSATRRREA